uniref:P-loop NTPase fold protein n=1 Tax=Carnobacterium sp. TaxID=48221 RepID=UPI00159869A2|nr:P-loop NTPase fold protein [Carnobacterium sp.]QJS06092.1 NTPase [Carnobacterium sp.]
MFNLKQSLINYITTKNTDYAIEINGKWGAGKTHYIKEFMIEQEEPMKEENKKFIYLSCNGIQTIEDFQTRLLNNIVLNDNALKKGLGKTYDYFNKYADLFDNKSEIALRFIGNVLNETNKYDVNNESEYRFILVLDDLERKSDKLSSKDLFGFISSYCLDSYHMKVIFIANEERITNVDKEFDLIKEKIIFNTFSFEHCNEDIFKEIIENRFESHTYQILDIDWLKSAFTTLTKGNNTNLRTILFIISSFRNLIDKLDKKNGNDSEQIYKMILCNLIIVSINYKNGTLKRVEELELIYSQKMVFLNMPNKDSTAGRILNKYTDCDFIIRNHIYFSRAISDLVINGYLDSKTYNKEIDHYLVKENLQESTPEQNAMEILNRFRNHTEEEVREAQNILYNSLTYVDTNTIQICNLLYQFQEMKLYFLENKSPLKKIIVALQSKKYNPKYFKISKYELEITFTTYFESMKDQAEYDEFRSLMYQNFIESNHIDIINKIKKIIKEPFDKIYTSISASDLSDINLIQVINDTPVFLEAILYHPSKSDYFNFLIKKNSGYFSNTSVPSESLHSIDKLLKNINITQNFANLDGIDKYKIKEFKNTVKNKKQEIIFNMDSNELES